MLAWGTGALAADDVEVITVEAERPAETATERSLDRQDVANFPARSAAELLRAMPGLHLSAHGGNGKAFQILLRGFDAAHGSDLAVTVEGVPLNEPSNVHGQGYLDLHFLPEVLVDGLDLVKGSYRAEDGDFAITGSADYRVGLAREGLLVETSLGTDRSGRGTVAWGGDEPGTFAVAEAEGAVGVGDGRRYHQLRAAAGLEAGPARLWLFAYHGAFESPGVLRADDLASGAIDFYGAYPESGGGSSARALAIGALEGRGVRATAWAGARALRLDQNFTGYLSDPVHGDGARQAELAGDGGLRVRAERAFDRFGAVRGGLDARAVAVDQTERAIDPSGVPWELRVDAAARQLDLAAWAEGRVLLGHLSLVPGVRVDRLALALRDRLGDERAASGATVLSPNGSASFALTSAWTVFGAYGRGFRSPEARGIADGDLAPIMTSDGGEGGVAWAPRDGLRVQATAFGIHVSDELVFDHVAGRFLSAGRTVRQGVEAVADWSPRPWLALQVDATYTDGRFAVDRVPIPYAPRWLGAAAVYLQGAPLGGGALSGGLRVWALGPRPLPSGFASHPALVGTLTGRLAFDRLEVGLEVDNLLGQRWRDGEFVFPSWFDLERPRSELKVLHVTAGDPFAVRLVLGIRPATSCRAPRAASCR